MRNWIIAGVALAGLGALFAYNHVSMPEGKMKHSESGEFAFWEVRENGTEYLAYVKEPGGEMTVITHSEGRPAAYGSPEAAAEAAMIVLEERGYVRGGG